MPATRVENDAPIAPQTVRRSRIWLWFVAALLLLWTAVQLIEAAACRTTDRQLFRDRYHGLSRYEESLLLSADGQQTLQVVLEGTDDLRLVGHLRAPLDSSDPQPALLLLGGFRTGRHSLDYIPATRGVVLLALDYPYDGQRSGLGVGEFLLALPAMRRAILDTVPAAMIAVDYLQSRPDVDADRIVLVAGSVGALFAPAIAATDRRIVGTALLFGGGDIESLIAVNARDDLGWLTGAGAWLGKVLTCPVEPLHHIGAIAPRPVFFLNGTEDLGIPERNSRLLFAAAQEPKSIRWIDAGHVTLRDQAFHDLVTRELHGWLVEQGFVEAGSFAPSAAQPTP